MLKTGGGSFTSVAFELFKLIWKFKALMDILSSDPHRVPRDEPFHPRGIEDP